MFSGIIEEIGIVADIQRTGISAVLKVQAKRCVNGLRIGDSVSVDGVCQTVTRVENNHFYCDTMAETIRKTTFGFIKKGNRVNLERALRTDARFDGHIVQGHISFFTRIVSRIPDYNAVKYGFLVPVDQMRFFVNEGSCALDGISLTVCKITGNAVFVSIIPHTLKNTALQFKNIGDYLNIETDILGRYAQIESHRTGLTMNRLKEMGF